LYAGLGIVMRQPLGQTRAAVFVCPHCSYLSNGGCTVCEDGDTHPGCEGCQEGRLPPLPWYRGELFLTIATSLVVSIASGIVVQRIMHQRLVKRGISYLR